MDSDPEDSEYILVIALGRSAILWTVYGIRHKKED